MRTEDTILAIIKHFWKREIPDHMTAPWGRKAINIYLFNSFVETILADPKIIPIAMFFIKAAVEALLNFSNDTLLKNLSETSDPCIKQTDKPAFNNLTDIFSASAISNFHLL